MLVTDTQHPLQLQAAPLQIEGVIARFLARALASPERYPPDSVNGIRRSGTGSQKGLQQQRRPARMAGLRFLSLLLSRQKDVWPIAAGWSLILCFLLELCLLAETVDNDIEDKGNDGNSHDKDSPFTGAPVPVLKH